jgi:hypothetical protein
LLVDDERAIRLNVCGRNAHELTIASITAVVATWDKGCTQ